MNTTLYYKTLQEKFNSKQFKNLDFNYSSNSNFEKSLKIFLNSVSLKEFFSKPFYDFNHNNESFIRRVIELINEDTYQLDQFLQFRQKLESFKKPYLFAETNFKRTTEPIIALGLMSSIRFLYLDKEEIYNLKESEVNNYINHKIDLFIKERGIKLPLFGKILSFTYFDLNHNRKTFKLAF